MGINLQINGLPTVQRTFLSNAVPRLEADNRLAGVAAGGSFITGTTDEFSDIDLVIVVQPEFVNQVMNDRMAIARSLGPLLSAFTGEHVGEPRLTICLYGTPLLHVDLKFVALPDLAQRVEDPVILWERDGALTREIARCPAHFPLPDLQWIEDRFWVWMHYYAGRLARGELFVVIEFLSFLRTRVFGPLALMKHGHLPRGVRHIERDAASELPRFLETLAAYDIHACGNALQAAAKFYRELRTYHADDRLIRRTDAEREALKYLDSIMARLATRSE